MHPVTGFVLTGGKSTRMGSDKAALNFGGQTLLGRAIDLLGSVSTEVRILGSSAKYSSLAPGNQIVEDIYSDRGPLGGIHAALSSTATELNLILAVDIPSMNTACLKYLIRRAEQSQALVVVPFIDGGLQPLCALYRRGFASNADAALKAGRNKVSASFQPATTLVIEQGELESAGFGPTLFRNVNTTDDWSNFTGESKIK